MLSRKREVFAPTEGVAALMLETEGWAARGADFSNPSLLSELGRLAFRSLMLRSNDIELADSQSCELSRKLEVRAGPLVRADALYAIDGKLFEAYRAEQSGRLSYLYLSEIATDGIVSLIAEKDSYDKLKQRRTIETSTDVFCRRVALNNQRSVAGASDRLAPSLTLTLRACDWDGETQAKRNGIRYAVVATHSSGRWLSLELSQLAGRRT